MVLLAVLVLPRSIPPATVPLPHVDTRLLARVADDDRGLAAEGRRHELPVEVRLLGTAIRDLHEVEAKRDLPLLQDRRVVLEDAIRAVTKDPWEFAHQLLQLRALQLEGFLREVERFESTGVVSSELEALAGAFIPRLDEVGWVRDHRVLLDDAQRRVAFKMVWNATLHLEAHPRFALSLDEQRTLYAFYLMYPHVPESRRTTIESARQSAQTPEQCARVEVDVRRLRSLWLAEKIRKLAQLDPSYPAAYALGVAYFGAGDYEKSAAAFQRYLDDQPAGPWTLSAQSHLKAALLAVGP